jgi:hypothetical protein
VTTPCLWFSRGEPQAKLLGTFSLVRFFGVSKEMNDKRFLKDFSVPLLCVPKEWGTPKKGHPGVSRPD